MEIPPFVTSLALAALCVPLASTRKYAVFFTAILVWIYPVHSFVVLAFGGVIFWYLKRRNANAIRRLSD